MATTGAPLLLLLTGACAVWANTVQPDPKDGPFVFEDFIIKDRQGRVVADVASGLPEAYQQPSSYSSCKRDSDGDVIACWRWPDGATISAHRTHDSCCFPITEVLPNNAESEINFPFDNAFWYGGNEELNHKWPLNKYKNLILPLATDGTYHRAIVDGLWFSSKGVLVYAYPGAAAFVYMNTRSSPATLTIKFSTQPPFRARPGGFFKVTYVVCFLENARMAFEYAVGNVIARPTGHPDERMVKYPVWSTWARYKTRISDLVVRDFAMQIKEHGFANSHIEIDDSWESCYGSKEPDERRFPRMRKLVDDLHAHGFRVTLWSHPFITFDCNDTLSEARTKGYLVQGENGEEETNWWRGSSGLIDFTNKEAADWFVARHEKLMREEGIDGFKFDVGEASWTPNHPVFHFRPSVDEVYPNLFTTKYVQTCARLDKGLTEVRTAFHTQSLPLFVRMVDKDSCWSGYNGLKAVVTSLLQMNMVGYPFVLPDMIGGNQYNGERASEELFVRWLQANTFMPAMQYSVAPWDYTAKAIEIARKFTDLHAEYSDVIVKAMKRAVAYGSPINPPIWWVDPLDGVALQEDSEFLLGENLLVAPVLEEGATTRDVYLPAGVWRDMNDPVRTNTVTGPLLIENYSAPLDTLPWFVRSGSDCDR